MRAFPQERLLDANGRVSAAWQRFFQSVNQNSSGGTVTNFTASGGDGINATVTNPTTSPNLSLSLGNITPLSVASSGNVSAGGNVSGTNLSGTNTGDQDLSGLVPKTTTVNGHALSANVTVTASDVGAVPSGGALGTPSSGNLSNCTSLPASGVTGSIPVSQGGTGITSFGWGTYTPTVTAGSGTITTVGTTSGRFFTIGKLMFFSASVAITTNGTAAGFVKVTLPNTYTVGSADYYGGGFALSAAKGLHVKMVSAQQYAEVRNYDGTYPGANGETLEISGWYELA